GLRDLLKELLAPYDDKDGDRVTIAGDDVPVTAQVSTPFALVFHELATNAAKYGALSDPDGKVEVTVARGDDGVSIDWVEQGGPPAQEAEQEGFGTRLITMTVDSQLNGKLDREWRDSGLHARLTVPESSL
ncbi:MAG: histidine kinase, partial [Sphingomonadales bacterium CG12_big_fil_rev_8_21_14_0_65_65_10]